MWEWFDDPFEVLCKIIAIVGFCVLWLLVFATWAITLASSPLWVIPYWYLRGRKTSQQHKEAPCN